AIEELQERAEAEALLDELADEPALVVGEHHLVREARLREALVELEDREEAPAVERVGEGDVPLADPGPVPLRLLEDRDPLGEPARDAVGRALERRDVAELVPE